MASIFEQLGLVAATESHCGPREFNEDSVDLCAEHGLLIIADGMGGGDEGDRASAEACATIRQAWSTGIEQNMEGSDLMQFAIRSVNTRIFGLAKERCADLGTTLTVAAFTKQDEVMIGQAGDSDLYRIRDGRAERLTEDHRVEGTNVLRVNIGGSETIKPFVRAVDWKDGDVLLLMTDGLSDLLTSKQIEGFHQHAPPNELIQRLVSDRENQVSDNYSCITCWGQTAVVNWWHERASLIRNHFQSEPSRAKLDQLETAATKSGRVCDLGQEVTNAWTPANDSELLSIAASLPSDEIQILRSVCGSSSGAISRLASLIVANSHADSHGNSDCDDGDVGLVRRAHEADPTADTALFLLKRTDPATPAFNRLMGYMLQEDPGPWYHAWTMLCSLASHPQGIAICRDVLQQLPTSPSIPGGVLVGREDHDHPLDAIVESLRKEWMDPLAATNAAFHTQLERQHDLMESMESRIESDRKSNQQAVDQMQQSAMQSQAGTDERINRIERTQRDDAAETLSLLSDSRTQLQRLTHEVERLERQLTSVEQYLRPDPPEVVVATEVDVEEQRKPKHGCLLGFVFWVWRLLFMSVDAKHDDSVDGTS